MPLTNFENMATSTTAASHNTATYSDRFHEEEMAHYNGNWGNICSSRHANDESPLIEDVREGTSIISLSSPQFSVCGYDTSSSTSNSITKGASVSGTQLFLPDERVFVKYGDDSSVYEAIIKKTRHVNAVTSWSYFIHFSGWNTRWDRWVKEIEILPDTPEARNLEHDTKNRIKVVRDKERVEKRKAKEGDEEAVRFIFFTIVTMYICGRWMC